MSTLIANPFAHGQSLDWASGIGQDKYGFYADWSINTGDEYWEFVTQRMRWIPGGTFMMGSPEDEPERWGSEGPQHEVTLSGFWLAETACTQSFWTALMGENPSSFSGRDRPVEQVSYEDALEFCSRANARIPGLCLGLPTEAQWEYGCRAGTKTPFNTGFQLTTFQANYDGNYPYTDGARGEYRDSTVDVKSFPCNAWGLYEMHGNVWEWCVDWFGGYPSESAENPVGPTSGSHRVIRGGGWIDGARDARSAFRTRRVPGNRSSYLGFRCVSSASPVQLPNK